MDTLNSDIIFTDEEVGRILGDLDADTTESEDQVQAEPTTVEEESEESVSHKANQNNANREFKSNNRKNKK
jgi:hypothetical protein